MSRATVLVPFLLLFITTFANSEELPELLRSGKLQWQSTEPLVAPAERKDDPCDAIKDPTVVFHDGRWHLFCTIRSHQRTHQIEYLSFTDWKDADKAERHVLKIHPGYFCAPQVFYFRPQKKWYMIYQASDESWTPKFQPAFSTADVIDDPQAWTSSKPLFETAPKVERRIDFWVICDAEQAYLFYNSNDGNFWRCEAKLSDFPHGWNKPKLAHTSNLFEASHTYRVAGHSLYLTIIEAQGPSGRRYYQAYTAEKLTGAWKPLATKYEAPFAGANNVSFAGEKWTESISHGELLRQSNDETLTISPDNLTFLYQGVSDGDRAGKPYGKIPWRLGLLKLKTP